MMVKPDTNIYRLGVVGLNEGRSVLSAAQTSPRWQVAQVCDLNESLCLSRCKEFGLEKFTLDYDELLANESIDVIAIYTPDVLHADHVSRALQAGKHVVCTNLLLSDLAQAGEVGEAVRMSGRKVLMGMSTRFMPTMMRQRRDFEAGRHGPMLSVETYYNDDKRSSRGRVMDWLYTGLTHPADLALWYLGEVAEVTGYGVYSSFAEGETYSIPDNLHFLLRSPRGEVAVVSGCFGAVRFAEGEPADILGCTIRGERGISWAGFDSLAYRGSFDGAAEHTSFAAQQDYYWRFGGRMHHAGEFQNYLDYFAECLDTGAEPSPGFAEGLANVALLDAMKRTLETGLPARPATVEELLQQGLVDAR